jgi:hypothetical protein
MELHDFTVALQQAFAPRLLNVLGAVCVLIVGWLVAAFARTIVRRGLGSLRLDERLGRSVGSAVTLERTVAAAVFWMIMLLTIVGLFDVLDLVNVSTTVQTIVTQVLGYLPRLLAAGLLLLVAWILATAARAAALKLMHTTALDRRLAMGANVEPLSAHAAGALFWLVLLLFVPAVVGSLGIAGLVGPLENLTTQLLDVLPELIAALLIAGIGWLVARILRGLVANALSALGLDRHARLPGSDRADSLSQAVGTVVYALVLVAAITAALEALNIKAISVPASAMLAQFFTAIPLIAAAAVILLIAWILARVISTLVARISAAAGIDGLPERLGFAPIQREAARPSRLLGSLTLFFIMLFAATEAASRLSLTRLADLLISFLRFASDVLLGAIILIIGWWLAGLAYAAIRQSSDRYGVLLAQIARIAIVGLVLGMGLRAMGFANDIVNLGFGLTLGAVAGAVALAFGLGGRDAAARLLERWRLQSEQHGDERKTAG